MKERPGVAEEERLAMSRVKWALEQVRMEQVRQAERERMAAARAADEERRKAARASSQLVYQTDVDAYIQIVDEMINV